MRNRRPSKKTLLLIVSLTTSFSLTMVDPFDCLPGRIAQAAVAVDSRFTPDLAYEMAQITARVIAAPTANHEALKAELAYATALVTTRVMPLVPATHQREFAYEMAKITTRLITDPTLDVEQSKAQYAYEMAQLTARIISSAFGASPPAALTPAPAPAPAPAKPAPAPQVQQSSNPVYTPQPVAPAPTRTASPPAVTQSEPDRAPVYNPQPVYNPAPAYKPPAVAQPEPDRAPVYTPAPVYNPPTPAQPEPDRTPAKVPPTAPAPVKATPPPRPYQPEPDPPPAKVPPTTPTPVKATPPPRVYKSEPDPVPARTAPPPVNPPNVTFSEPQLRDNADIVHGSGPQPVGTQAQAPKTGVTQPSADPGYISKDTYTQLVDELNHVGQEASRQDKTVKVDGEARFHFALNKGDSPFDQNSSGLRIRVAADTALMRDWRLYGSVEMQNEITNYGNDIRLSRLYAGGKLGIGQAKIGRFGYLMAEGNIYDSGFTGFRYDITGNNSVKYTVAAGATEDSEATTVATARYQNLDYDIEAGVYHDRPKGGEGKTIWSLGGNYYLSDVTIGAMVLSSSEKDSIGNKLGYIFSINHGELKTWRPGTYNAFLKYYNQPRGTYIAHGMNGAANKMEGFQGFGTGVSYTFAENLVGSLEYYRLKDKVTGKQGNTLWMSISNYF